MSSINAALKTMTLKVALFFTISFKLKGDYTYISEEDSGFFKGAGWLVSSGCRINGEYRQNLEILELKTVTLEIQARP